jgi:hypothetical protein
MIQFVKREQLNEDKYNLCISTSLQCRIYAYSWYLDIVADNWSALVLDDYQAVMPLPWKRKFMIHYVAQPFFTQQLGVFSKGNLSKEEARIFIHNIPGFFKKITLQFNSHNHFLFDTVERKNNFILNLNHSYCELYKQFSKGRKHAIQQGLKNGLNIEEVAFEDILTLSKDNYSFKELSEKEYQKLTTLVKVAKKKNLVRIIGIKKENELIGGAVFLLNTKRIVYLFSAISQKGKEMQVGSLLLNSIVQENCNSKRMLDFEGSMNPSIASFFKSFGAKIETYTLLKKRLL